ncbi:hypothetical protein COO60DRAFT_995690 [Scenedesmus sp. NREL 46B-D3]|nr:hypothetical protein COO60DRAFT_995690 [Scenedesmus sp. NREL 46B-D3]
MCSCVQQLELQRIGMSCCCARHCLLCFGRMQRASGHLAWWVWGQGWGGWLGRLWGTCLSSLFLKATGWLAVTTWQAGDAVCLVGLNRNQVQRGPVGCLYLRWCSFCCAVSPLALVCTRPRIGGAFLSQFCSWSQQRRRTAVQQSCTCRVAAARAQQHVMSCGAAQVGWRVRWAVCCCSRRLSSCAQDA